MKKGKKCRKVFMHALFFYNIFFGSYLNNIFLCLKNPFIFEYKKHTSKNFPKSFHSFFHRG